MNYLCYFCRDINWPRHCLSTDDGRSGPHLPHPPPGCLLPLQALLDRLHRAMKKVDVGRGQGTMVLLYSCCGSSFVALYACGLVREWDLDLWLDLSFVVVELLWVAALLLQIFLPVPFYYAQCHQKVVVLVVICCNLFIMFRFKRCYSYSLGLWAMPLILRIQFI